MDKKEILKKVDILYLMWKQGKLGGEVKFETVSEFRSFLDSDEDDIL